MDRGGETAELEVSKLLSFFVWWRVDFVGIFGCSRVVICGQDVVLSVGRLVC